MRITPFVRLWLTTTINELCLFEGGRSVTRSTESCLNGKGEEEGMGVSGGTSGVMVDFVLLTCGAPRYEGIDK